MIKLLHVTLCVALISCTVVASEYSYKNYLSGNWGGEREHLHNLGVDLKLNYTTEPASSISGGYQNNYTYLHNIGAEFDADLEKLLGIKKTTFLAKFSSRSGQNVSEEYVVPASAQQGRYVYGEYFNKSQEIYGGQKTKMVNFQVTTQLTKSTSFDVGRLVMNDFFLRSDLYCDFMSNSTCGAPKGVFTPYALDAYPDATMGAHAAINITPIVDLHVGIFDGGWTKQQPYGFDWGLGKNGTAFSVEAQLFLQRGSVYGTQKVLKFGATHHSGEFDNYKSGKSTKGNSSYYILADIGLYSEDSEKNQGLSIFGSYIYNPNEEISALNHFFNLGFVYRGLINSRSRDKLGLNYVFSKHSKYNTYTHNYISGQVRSDESIIELSYNFVLPYGINIMPDMQYIHHPNGSSDFSDVTVLGAKFSVNF
ncbi:MAG: carbohydrate porin [Campylobacterota bacterium]|nr:carbohydrate porin [Campylobacterota bacterium]